MRKSSVALIQYYITFRRKSKDARKIISTRRLSNYRPTPNYTRLPTRIAPLLQKPNTVYQHLYAKFVKPCGKPSYPADL